MDSKISLLLGRLNCRWHAEARWNSGRLLFCGSGVECSGDARSLCPFPDLCKLLCIVAKSNGSVKIATKAGVVQDCRSNQQASP